jgi:multidrug resistance efflux pump
MLELLFCATLTVLPDYLFRRYAQGRRLGYEITFFSVWYELRYGITLCLLLTISLITVVFYFHPSTTAAVSYFRTVSVMPDSVGRVVEVYAGLNEDVVAGQPLFKLDTDREEAALAAAKLRAAEVTAQIAVTRTELVTADAQIAQAEAALKQATDELTRQLALRERDPGVVTQRQIDTLQSNVDGRQAALEATRAQKQSLDAQITVLLPAQQAAAEASVAEAQVLLDHRTVIASVDGRLTQFTLRPGDILNPNFRSAGVLVPKNAGQGYLQAGFSQIEAQVLKPGMTAEALCLSQPFAVIPMVVTGVQSVIATGQFQATDRLVDPAAAQAPGSVLTFLEPMFDGGFDQVPPGSSCIVNAYTSNHERLHSDEDLSTGMRVWLHAVDTVGIVHAILLRSQALLMPVRALVLSGGH